MSDTAKVLNTFYGVFRGNTSFFVKHQAPFNEKNGKLTADWCGFAVYNNMYTPPPKGKEEGDYVPLTIDKYREHLNGGDGLAISPLTNVEDVNGNVIKRNVCYFAVIDIDVYGVNFTWLINKLYQHGFRFVAERSKSGGLHLFFFFAQAEPADKVIETLKKVVEVFGLNKLFVNSDQKSKVEIFPKQSSYIPGSTRANCIFLPFHGLCKNKVIFEGKLISVTKALPIIETMFTSIKEINATLSELPYSDAPFCIQMILLSGVLSEGDFRNNFIFCVAIYMRLKYGDEFSSALEDANNCLREPLEEDHVKAIYKSVTDKKREKYLCKEPPCSNFCDKKLCKQREYAPNREKGNHSTGADSWGLLTRYDTGDGKEPYYKWQVRIEENGEYQTVQIDSHKDLLNQLAVQQNCLRDLNWVPVKVRDDIWVNNVLSGLVGIENRTVKVERSADTTEVAMLRDAFFRFLTHTQVQKNAQPYMVGLSKVYHADGKFYFTTKGMLDFFKFDKTSVGRINLREWLIQLGCIENVALEYEMSTGGKKTIMCWAMSDSDELANMDVFYEDLYECDADNIRKNKLNKEDVEDDSKF